MSKIIYLISFLNKMNKLFVVLMVISLVALFLSYFVYYDNIRVIDDSEEKAFKRFFKVTGVFLVISTLATVLIPSKDEMYMMALTKDYEVEDVYKMTKDEIKGSIDYVFDRMKELKND